MPAEFKGMNSLVVQAFDLGLVVPFVLISAILLFRKSIYGIVMAFAGIVKVILMALAIQCMIILKGVDFGEINWNELLPFLVIFLIGCYFGIRIFIGTKNDALEGNINT